MSTIADKIKNLPQAPGVYFFRGLKGEILYIGKATNLRSRVQSYFRSVIPDLIRNPEMLKQVQHDKKIIVSVAGRSEWIGSMVSQILDIDFEQTDSVLEALILESNLIKKHQPKYNTLEKDDKSFSYFVITKEEFPRVLIFRATDIDFKKLEAKNQKLKAVFGPYTSKYQMQVALKIMRRIFPFHALRQKSEKGCLDFQIGLCPGPYVEAISKIDYQKNIRGIKMILDGKKKSLVKKMEKEMQVAAKKNEFEKAAQLRNKIFALQHIRDVALMNREFENMPSPQPSPGGRGSGMEEDFRIEAYDISNISGQHAVGSMVVFEDGRANKNQYRKFKIKTVDGANDIAMMKEVLLRRFKNDWAMPDLVLLDGGVGHVNMADELLHKQLGLAVAIVGVAKGLERKNLNFQFPISNKFSMNQFPKELREFLNDKNKVKNIMDEAHRFAISYHRKLRSRNALR